MNTHFGASNLVIPLKRTFERYQIAIPNFKEFIRRLGEQLQLFNKAYLDFHQEVYRFLPADVPEEKVHIFGSSVITLEIPSDEQIKTVEILSQNYHSIGVTLLEYITDLRIETQNSLLGNIFDKKITGGSND